MEKKIYPKNKVFTDEPVIKTSHADGKRREYPWWLMLFPELAGGCPDPVSIQQKRYNPMDQYSVLPGYLHGGFALPSWMMPPVDVVAERSKKHGGGSTDKPPVSNFPYALPTTAVSDKTMFVPVYKERSFSQEELDRVAKDADSTVRNIKRTSDVKQNPVITNELRELARVHLNYLKGFTPAQQVAILANLAHESGLDYTRKGSNGAKGVVQFDPNGELPKYEKWRNENEFEDNDESQYKYLVEEMINGENYDRRTYFDRNGQKNVGKGNNVVYRDYSTEDAKRDWNSDNPYLAARAFLSMYERAGKPRTQNRMTYVDDMIEAFYPGTYVDYSSVPIDYWHDENEAGVNKNKRYKQ